jgi:hypothetical protein
MVHLNSALYTVRGRRHCQLHFDTPALLTEGQQEHTRTKATPSEKSPGVAARDHNRLQTFFDDQAIGS